MEPDYTNRLPPQNRYLEVTCPPSPERSRQLRNLAKALSEPPLPLGQELIGPSPGYEHPKRD